jgi:hypothetical protein
MLKPQAKLGGHCRPARRMYHAGRSSSGQSEKFSTVPTQACCASLIGWVVMSSIMRRRNGLVASSVMGRFCFEKVANPSSQDRTPHRAIGESVSPQRVLPRERFSPLALLRHHNSRIDVRFSNRPSGSSTFRPSTTPVSMSLAGSRFSSDSAPRPFHHGFRRRGGTIFRATLPSM